MQSLHSIPKSKRFLRLLALATAALATTIAGTHASAAQSLTVRSVGVTGPAGQPQIEVKTSGPVSPATQAVVGPDRIVVDFPGALPASTLRKLASVNRGGLKSIRTGLFQAQPPITRVVLDVDGPTDYQVVPSGNSIIIKLGHPEASGQVTAARAAATPPVPQQIAPAQVKMASGLSSVQFRVVRKPISSLPDLQVVNTVASISPIVSRAMADVAPPQPKLEVGVRSNRLSIRAQGATLAEVLYEIHRRTGADIAIPAGAEQERVVVNIPSAPGRDVIASLLNGSRFNYIVLGTDSDPGGFRNILLSVKEGGGGSSGTFVHTTPPPNGGIPPAMQAQAMQNQPMQPSAIGSPNDTVIDQSQVDQSQMDPAGVAQAAPELEPIPDEPAPAEPDATTPRPEHPQQVPVQNVPDAGQVPQ